MLPAYKTSYVSKTNRFFIGSVYSTCADFAVEPISHVFARKSNGEYDGKRLLIGFIFSPFLILGVINNTAFALAFAAVAAVVHVLSLLVAGIADYSDKNEPAMAAPAQA